MYLPQFGIALEFQAAQHLGPVDYFGGEKVYEQQKRRDVRKKKLCAKNSCTLVEVFQGYAADDVVGVVQSHVATLDSQRPVGSPPTAEDE